MERDRQKDVDILKILHPVVHLPNASNRQGWARPKLEARNSVQFFLIIVGTQEHEP